MSEKGPMVSVIVAMYNMEAFVEETLRSVLQSTFTDLEIIVMDDGSTDASGAIVARIAETDARVRLLHQANKGVCVARNAAIEAARGRYLLPVDADDVLLPHFIADAVARMEADEELKAVVPQGEYFGARSGLWHLKPFSLRLLARKNMLPITALYRRADWERVGGYCEEIIAREDWEFWIHLLKDGGRIERTDEVGLRYRIREGSKRKSDRRLRRHVVDVLNARHPEFFERELGGRLHYQRSWSRLFNRIYRLLHPRRVVVNEHYVALDAYVRALPRIFQAGWGSVIHDRRNLLRRLRLRDTEVVVKSFAVPNIINRFAYGLLRPSKAQRSYEYARMLQSWGIDSPQPVAWTTERRLLLLTRSYYVSLASTLPYSYNDILASRFTPDEEARFLTAIAQTTARLHEHHCWHSDYSRGNILFGLADGRVRIELIDLNRLRFGHVSLEAGCRNFAERLPMTPAQRKICATAYAEARGGAAAQCEQWMQEGQREFS